MRRRELLKAAAAGVVLDVGYASKAAAQSKPEMQKERTMAGLDVNTATISIEHVTIASQKSFESVRAALERLVPRIDDGIFVLLRYGEAERARRELEQAPNSFPSSVSGIMKSCSESMDCSKKQIQCDIQQSHDSVADD